MPVLSFLLKWLTQWNMENGQVSKSMVHGKNA
jgi:hypothetical protein